MRASKTMATVQGELKRVGGRSLRRASEARRNEAVLELTSSGRRKRYYAVPKTRVDDAMDGLPDALALQTSTAWIANLCSGR